MEKKLLFKGKKCALLETGGNYIVAIGYNKDNGTWEHGKYFGKWNWRDKILNEVHIAQKLYDAMGAVLCIENNHDYVTRDRAIEIATCAIQNLGEEGRENFFEDSGIDQSEYEMQFFGLNDLEDTE